MTETLPTLTVVAGVMQQAGCFLVCQRHHASAFGLKWEFPGGKVEPGETAEEALQRELREELGIETQIGAALYRTCHAYPGTYIVQLLFYQVTSVAGSPQNLAFENIRWGSLAALDGLDFLEGDAAFLAALKQGRLAGPALPDTTFQSQP